MATSLLWKAYELNNKLFTERMYPHLISMDTKEESYQIERNGRKLVPLYISFALTLYIKAVCFFIVLEYALHKPEELSLHFSILCFEIFCLIGLPFSLNVIFIGQGELIFEEWLNSLFEFDRKLRMDKRPKEYTRDIFSKTLIRRELNNVLRKDMPCDVIGIVMCIIVLLYFIIGTLFACLAFFTHLHPLYYIICNIPLQRNGLAITTLKMLFTLFAAVWVNLEACRSLTLVILPLLCSFGITPKCLKIIAAMPPDERSTRLYTELSCVCRISVSGFRDMGQVLMSVGYLLTVLGAWVLIVGLKTFPIIIYILLSFIAAITFVAELFSLSFVCACYKFSKHLLRWEWSNRSYGFWKRKTNSENILRCREYKGWRKRVIAQVPISFCYGPARFDEDTTTNFFSNAIEHAVNLILVSG